MSLIMYEEGKLVNILANITGVLYLCNVASNEHCNCAERYLCVASGCSGRSLIIVSKLSLFGVIEIIK